MKKMVLGVLLLLSQAFGSFQAYGIGIEFDQAILGCLMGGGNCFTKTGIAIIDSFFGVGIKEPVHTDDSLCLSYLRSWCSGPAGHSSGYELCRDSKKLFYKTAQVKMGKWPSDEDLHNRYGNSYRTFNTPRELLYIDDIEDEKSFRKPRFFTCTARQQHFWLKNRCGHTAAYREWGWSRRDNNSPELWDKVETETCGD